jgi:glycoside/pentoside/hexuronide:cation symporter, GPH family
MLLLAPQKRGVGIVTARLTVKEKLGYGLGDLSGNIMFSAISFFLLYFFINVGGLNPGLAAVVFLIARFWDAVTDFWMGSISDRTNTRWGKKRVYMLFGAVPYGLMFILLWLVPFGEDATQTIRFLYYTFAYLLYNTTWTIVYIPYNALTANMTGDYDERTSLNAYRIVMANIGILLGAAVFALLADGTASVFFQIFGSEKIAYSLAGAIFGLLALIIMLICATSVTERTDYQEQNIKSLLTTLLEFFRLKEFRNIITYYLLSMIGFDIIMATFIFFINDALAFGGGGESMLFVAIPLLTAIISAAFWVYLSEKYSKHKTYAAASIFMFLVLLFCLIIPPQNYFALISICIGAGIGMSAIQILPFASLPDVIEVDQFVNGSRREGAYYGINQFMYKLASGVSIAFVSFVLGLYGYQELAPVGFIQPESALKAIRVLLGIVPGTIFLISIIFAYRANLGRERYNKIAAEINNRVKGLS